MPENFAPRGAWVAKPIACDATAGSALDAAPASWTLERRGRRRSPESDERDLSPGELRESASWIRQRSRQLRQQCEALRVPHMDVGEAGFEAALTEAWRLLLGRG
jgi:hypothetical protein